MMNRVIVFLGQNETNECGIPIRSWILTFLKMFTARSFFQLLKIFFVKNSESLRGTFDIFRLTFIDGIIIGWLMYGNNLNFSDANDCDSKAPILYLAMISILAIGYITMIIYTIALCSIPYNLLFNYQ
jgi:hypothetical protein